MSKNKKERGALRLRVFVCPPYARLFFVRLISARAAGSKPVPRAVVAGEGERLDAPHKGVFSFAITVYVVREFFRERLFEFGIFLARVFVRAQIVAEGKMPPKLCVSSARKMCI